MGQQGDIFTPTYYSESRIHAAKFLGKLGQHRMTRCLVRTGHHASLAVFSFGQYRGLLCRKFLLLQWELTAEVLIEERNFCSCRESRIA